LTAKLLHLKQYSTTIFATATHNTQDYDFFNSVIEDTQSYGVNTGYRTGPVPVTLSFIQTHRDTSGFNYDTISDQSNLDLHARNERKAEDFTDLSYQFSQYDSTTSTTGEHFHDSNTFHYVTLNDLEHFHSSTLNSTLLYDHTDSSDLTSDDLNIYANYAIDHTPSLRSLYDYSFSLFSGDDGDSIQNTARAGLQHQLYESLSTSADIHGATVNSTLGDSTLDIVSGGVTASLNYTKRLISCARLTMGDTVTYDLTDQETSGSSLLVPRESHALPAGQWVRLNQPRIISLVGVTTDSAHGQLPLTEGIDYVVDRARDPWQLQRSPFSIILSDSNNVVLVTYTVEPNPSGSYSTLANQSQIRLDLWNGLLGLYARYSFTENYNGSSGFILEDVSEFQGGADCYWRGVRLNANYTDRESTLYSYYSYNLHEGYSSGVFAHSTFGADFVQRWTYYPRNASGATGGKYDVTYYDFVLRYAWHPVTSLELSAEAGYQQQRGNGLDEDLYVVRSFFTWFIGKLDFHLGYEFQKQEYSAENRDRHFLFLRAKRSF